MNDHFYQIYLNISLRLWTVIGISNFLLDIFRKKACKGNHFYRISNFLNFSLDFSKFFFSIFLEKKKKMIEERLLRTVIFIKFFKPLSTPMNSNFYRISNFSNFSRRLWTVAISNFSNFFISRKKTIEGRLLRTAISIQFFQTSLQTSFLFLFPKENEQKNKIPMNDFILIKNIFNLFPPERLEEIEIGAYERSRVSVYSSCVSRTGRALSCKRSHQPDSYPDVDKFPRRV